MCRLQDSDPFSFDYRQHNMTLDTSAKEEIRTALLLELNNSFTTISKHYEQHDDLQMEFLQTLITSIREYVRGRDNGIGPD